MPEDIEKEKQKILLDEEKSLHKRNCYDLTDLEDNENIHNKEGKGKKLTRIVNVGLFRLLGKNWRITYQLIAGILFISIGIIFFAYSKRFTRVFNIKILGVLLWVYGFYRIFMFIKLFKKVKKIS